MTNYGPPCPDCINHLDKAQCPVCGFMFKRGDPYWTAARYREALQRAIERIEDLLKGDDGQAWKEAQKVLPKLKQALKGTD